MDTTKLIAALERAQNVFELMTSLEPHEIPEVMAIARREAAAIAAALQEARK